MMLHLLLVPPHRHWIVTQHARPRASPLISFLWACALLISLHLQKSLSQKHSSPYFNHAPQIKATFPINGTAVVVYCNSVKPQCAISPISHCRCLMYDSLMSFECEQDGLWKWELCSEWSPVGEGAEGGKWMSNAWLKLLSGQQRMSMVVLGSSQAWIYGIVWMWSTVLLKEKSAWCTTAASDKYQSLTLLLAG